VKAHSETQGILEESRGESEELNSKLEGAMAAGASLQAELDTIGGDFEGLKLQMDVLRKEKTILREKVEAKEHEMEDFRTATERMKQEHEAQLSKIRKEIGSAVASESESMSYEGKIVEKEVQLLREELRVTQEELATVKASLESNEVASAEAMTLAAKEVGKSHKKLMLELEEKNGILEKEREGREGLNNELQIVNEKSCEGEKRIVVLERQVLSLSEEIAMNQDQEEALKGALQKQSESHKLAFESKKKSKKGKTMVERAKDSMELKIAQKLHDLESEAESLREILNVRDFQIKELRSILKTQAAEHDNMVDAISNLGEIDASILILNTQVLPIAASKMENFNQQMEEMKETVRKMEISASEA